MMQRSFLDLGILNSDALKSEVNMDQSQSQSQRELRQAAAKAFMESLEQLEQEFQLPAEENKETDQPLQIPSVPLEQLLDLPVSSEEPPSNQDSRSTNL